jgi:hypothetical protein
MWTLLIGAGSDMDFFLFFANERALYIKESQSTITEAGTFSDETRTTSEHIANWASSCAVLYFALF